MAIESTATISGSASATKNSSSSNTDNSKKTSTDSSFKDEMEKVATKDTKKESTKIEDKKQDPKTEQKLEAKVTKEERKSTTKKDGNDFSKYGSMALLNAGNMLTNDIEQMLSLNSINSVNSVNDSLNNNIYTSLNATIFSDSNSINVSLNQKDAEFFIDLTQQKEINVQNINVQAQNMLNNGAEITEVKQNVQVSQTLLDAINKARETNQPLRIDFDQNMSVILRIGRDGALSANFIPGDKAVEQYLKNNIEQLKSTFDEKDLPYKELSYSQNKGGNNQKRNNKRQGDDK